MRTTHLDEDGQPKYTNRLVDEASPYLLQHAHNPVDWYPWGAEAFERAKQEDKPVFLSIGYSTCHWCHVMEGESFDDEQIAALLNEHFISIKLDREQRPDLDDIYMTGVQMLTGQGGWPMSNFLTPEGAPFFAGTYFPPDHFRGLLEQIVGVWRDRREEVDKQAREVAQNIARFTAARAETRQLPDDLIEVTTNEILGRLDEVNGGFGGAPKFPNEVMLSVLVDAVERSGSAEAHRALSLTLDKMGQGGIFDHVAGGFHRYTVDAIWLVPHFEKMLYNQAQLLRVYARAARLTGSAAWRRVAEQTVQYVLRDMRDGDGRFFSATDADSEGEEGRFFVWTREQLEAALGAEDAAFVCALYQVTDAGNFEGANILNLSAPLPESDYERVDRIHHTLYDVREQREHPLRDEKVITGWNAMMITSLASAGQDLREPAWVEAAARAADALWASALDGDDLWRITIGGLRSIRGNLEDHAFFAEAQLVLYAVTGNALYLDRGQWLVDRMIALFHDEADGGFFLSLDEDEGPMFTRPKSPTDGATASANSAALHALVWLWRVTGRVDIEQTINGCIGAFAGLIASSPSAFSYMNLAIDNFRRGQTGPVQFAGNGSVRVVVAPTADGARVTLSMADDWHVNADSIDDDQLIPTRVEAGAANVVYPASSGGHFEGEVDIDIEGNPHEVTVTLQPCSGKLCLAPETLRFSLRVASR